MNIRTVTSSGCDRKCCYKCPCGTCMCVSSGTHPGTELLRHMVARISMLEEPPGRISSWPCHFVFLSGFGFFHILSSSCYLTFESQVVIFNDHFPPLRKTDSIHSIFSILLSRIAKFHLVSYRILFLFLRDRTITAFVNSCSRPHSPSLNKCHHFSKITLH